MAKHSERDDFFAGVDEARASALVRAPAADQDAWRLITELTDLLNSPIDRFDQVLEAALDATIRTTRADRGLIMLRGPDGQLDVRLARDLDLAELRPEERRVSASIVDEVVRTGRGVAIPDLGEIDRFSDSASIQDLKLLSVMCVPLIRRTGGDGRRPPPEGRERRAKAARPDHQVIGALYVDSRSVRTSFSTADLEQFQAVANVVTTAILHASDFRRATTDELTGLATRRQLERRLADELELLRRAPGGELTALLVDIDHLREVNHVQGYAAGDRVLQTVARTLRQRTRQQDVCGRYGGEELVLVLPGTNVEWAEEVARKLLVSLQAEGVSVSIGVAAAEARDTSQSLVRRCDQALSQAKLEGGGRRRTFSGALQAVPPSTDKLSGIFSGDSATVYRNVLVLLESIPRIHQATSVDAVLERVLESVIDLARAERGFLFVQEPGKEVAPQLGFDRRRNGVEATGVDRAALERAMQSGEPVAYPAVEPGAASVICVPFGGPGAQGWRALYLEAREAPFSEGALAFAGAFARQAGIAIENARLLEENRAYARKTEKLMRALEDEREHLVKDRELVRAAAEVVAPAEDAAPLAPAAAARAPAGAAVPARAGGAPGRPSSAAADSAPSPALAPPAVLRPGANRYNYDRIIGDSEPMRRVFRMLDRVTASTVPVFIHGESGTGKELVARAIHFNGPRARSRFVAENCAAMSETLLESELFGYVRGAFTGAHADRPGLFELADSGTLFLDEVGDMTAAMQTKLLRVLQEGEVRRVGGKDVIKVDVRMISASNKDIQRMVEAGTFREDLYYRLNVVRIDLPPLRDRRADLPLLLDHFLRDDGTLDKPRKTVSARAQQIIFRYGFPGNVRELRNVIERAKILAEGDEIDVDAILLDTDGPLGPLPVSESRRASPPGAEILQRERPLPTPEPQDPVERSPALEAVYFELNDRQRRLVDYLCAYGSIKNRDYYEIMGVSKSTGWRDLKDLMDRNLIRVTGRGKGSLYSLSAEVRGSTA